MDNNFYIINLAESTPPKFCETRKNYIPWGEDNQLPDKLIEYSNNSATHHSILQTKIDGVSGDYIITNNKNIKEKELLKFTDKLAADLEIVGAAAIEVIYSRNKEKIVEYNHIPIQNLRYAKMSNDEYIPSYMYYSRDWSNTRKNKPIPIKIYDENNPAQEANEIILIKKYWAGNPYQILPSYYGAIDYIQIDKEISNFHLNNLRSGMSPGVIISFNDGIKDDEVKNQIVKGLQEKYSGTNQAGKLMVFFNKNKDNAVEVRQMEASDLGEMFTILTETTSQQILTSHQLTNPQLAGIKTPGELGGGGMQLLQAYELFFDNVIKPDQRLIEEGINTIFEYNEEELIELKNNKVITFAFDSALIQDNLTQNEIRELMGYEPLVNDEEVSNNDEENTDE